MKHTLKIVLMAAGIAGGAIAQTAPVGGSDAKGNAPIKHAHTVNDGSAKPGANSFTQGQAMRHIEHSGYTGVSGLAKGKDGVWRGTAMKNGAPVDVAMDFKGNVTQGMTEGAAPAPMESSGAASPMTSSTSGPAPTMARHHHHWRHHHWHHRHHHSGVGMSGIDRNKNGVSDKEDRAIARH